LKHIDASITKKIEALQPYHTVDGISALGALADLSNIDKHRVVHVVARPPGTGVVRINPGPDDFHNCHPVPGKGIVINYALAHKPLRRDDEVARIYVVTTGPNADVDLDASVTANITFHGDLDLRQSLNAMWFEVSTILTFFAPFLEGPSMGHA
jgi:hypothetical protein